ncbi:MAG: hypothetical protein R3E77_10650 [Steroidobacteraceae bacterium]
MKPADKTAQPGRLLRHRVHKGRRTAPGRDPRVDTLVGMIMALTSEVSILRDRLDSHERLNGAGVSATQDAVEAYVPDAQAETAREQMRQRLLDKVCRPLLAARGESSDESP